MIIDGNELLYVPGILKGMDFMKPKGVSKNRKGQSLVETALILPIIILILTGIIDFGLLFNNYLIIANASREGARRAAVGSTNTEIISNIATMTQTLNQSRLRVTITPSEFSRKSGDEINVSIEYDNNLLTPVISNIIPNPVHLRSNTVMMIE